MMNSSNESLDAIGIEDVEQLWQTKNIQVVNASLVETNVKFIGDKTTISQVVQLLAYIRNAINNNAQQDIKVEIGKNVINTPFAFSVNDQEINDYVAKDTIEIN